MSLTTETAEWKAGVSDRQLSSDRVVAFELAVLYVVPETFFSDRKCLEALSRRHMLQSELWTR